MTPKRASGRVRRAVLDALSAAVATRGPGCFESQRAAARELSAALSVSESTVRRALADPTLKARVTLAVKPSDTDDMPSTAHGWPDGTRLDVATLPSHLRALAHPRFGLARGNDDAQAVLNAAAAELERRERRG